MNRIYPQYIVYERDAPPEARINLVFNRRDNTTTTANEFSTQSSTTLTQTTSLTQSENSRNRVLYSIQQFLQRNDPIVSQANIQNNRIPSSTPTSLTIPLSNFFFFMFYNCL